MTTALAPRLAAWSAAFVPSEEDRRLAERALRDTVAVAYAARHEPLLARVDRLGEAGRWAVAAHALDFDDLHMSSTAHLSAVVVPVVMATGGDLTDYLAGAGVAARVGSALGWSHYSRGWHATCAAGAVGAAVAASRAEGLSPEETAHAIVLAAPAVGGVQGAFGSDVKAVQVGFAADAGVRAAQLASDGVRGRLDALEPWLELIGAESTDATMEGPAIPGGLAVKLYPCGYAAQRAISCARTLRGVPVDEIEHVRVRTPESTVKPLIYHRPETGTQAKFSLEYGVAAALIDGYPGFASFTDEAVQRPLARQLMARTELITTPGGDGLLSGLLDLEVTTNSGERVTGTLETPPGAPGLPPSEADFERKIADCGLVETTSHLTIDEAATLLRTTYAVASTA